MGRVIKPKYAWTKKDGTRVEKTTKAWYMEYTDAGGRFVRRKAGTTKEQAQDALRKAESDVLSERNGLPTQKVSDMTYSELMESYLTALKPHVVPVHLRNRRTQLEYLVEDGVGFVKQLTPDRIESVMSKLEDKGLAIRTVNVFLTGVKAMFNWAVYRRLMLYNPINCVRKRPELVRRRGRRALSDKEFAALLKAALEGPARRNERAYKGGPVPLEIQADLAEQGRRNALIYTLLAGTGLRVNELRSITWVDVDLEVGEFTTRSWWSGNKNKKEETLPMAPFVRESLKNWMEKHPGEPTDKIVDVPAGFVRTFNEDILDAGLAKLVKVEKKWVLQKRDGAGRTIDLHALRHTFGTNLVRSGADIKTVQALMRHSTPVLTLGIYVHMDRSRMRSAVASLSAPQPIIETNSREHALANV